MISRAAFDTLEKAKHWTAFRVAQTIWHQTSLDNMHTHIHTYCTHTQITPPHAQRAQHAQTNTRTHTHLQGATFDVDAFAADLKSALESVESGDAAGQERAHDVTHAYARAQAHAYAYTQRVRTHTHMRANAHTLQHTRARMRTHSCSHPHMHAFRRHH